MIVEWSVPAKDDLIAIADYIATDDPVAALDVMDRIDGDRKSTRLNSSHVVTSYAVFCCL